MADDPEIVVRRVLEAFNAGDVDTLAALCHPDVVIVEDPSFPDARTYHGQEGMREMAARWSEVWSNVSSSIVELSVEGDTVRIRTHFSGEGVMTGVPVKIEGHASRYTVRDGKVVALYLGIS